MSEIRIMVIGATGRFAGMVLPELARRGAAVRAFIRKPEEADSVRQHGASEVAVGDLRDSTSLDAAMRDVDRVFYIAPAFASDEVEIGKKAASAARQANVKRFVFSSVIHPELSALRNHSAKAPVEDAVLTSGMEYSFLHPAIFFQNYEAAWDGIVKTGILAEPYSPDQRMSRVDYRDVAEVAAIALTEDRLLYGTFELCADGLLNRHDVARLMGQALGREISVATPGFEEWTRMAHVPHESDVFAPLKAMYGWYDEHELLGNAVTLKAILGRDPRSLLAYFQERAK